MKKVKELRIVFENCEGATIPINDIYNWTVQDIKESIRTCNDNESYTHKRADLAFIIFNDLKNLYYKGFCSEPEKSLYKRLTSYSDVTHIDIVYEDGSNDYIGVPYGGGFFFKNSFAFCNTFQSLYKSKYGEYVLEFYDKWTWKARYRYIKYFFKVLIPIIKIKINNYKFIRNVKKHSRKKKIYN